MALQNCGAYSAELAIAAPSAIRLFLETIKRLAISLLVVSLSFTVPAVAVEPDEILADPALEARARAISKNLRCVVCRNQSIDDSDAGLAKDLRVVVRERLAAGDTDEKVLEFVVDRYGEYVLLRPRFTPQNAVLYLGGPLLLILGGVLAWRTARRGKPEANPDIAPLSEEERRRVEALMNGSDKS